MRRLAVEQLSEVLQGQQGQSADKDKKTQSQNNSTTGITAKYVRRNESRDLCKRVVQYMMIQQHGQHSLAHSSWKDH